MKAKDIMTKNPVWLTPDTKLPEISKKMRKLDIGIVPIGDGNKLLGMVSDRDIALCLSECKDPLNTTARQIMRKEIFYCCEDDSIEKVAKDMEKLQIRRMIILDNHENKKLTGVISLGDLATHGHNKKLCGEIVEMVSKAA